MRKTQDRLSFFFPSGFIYLANFLILLFVLIIWPLIYEQNPFGYDFWSKEVLTYGLVKGFFIFTTYWMSIFAMLYSFKLCLATPCKTIFFPDKVVFCNVFGLKRIIFSGEIRTVHVQEISPYVSEISLEMQVGKKVSFRVMRNGSVEPSVLKMWKSDCGMFQ